MSAQPDPDAFDRVTTRIGDLDHPFYAEERRRDVWNEASAVGFQLLLWGLLVAATLSVWVAGRPAHPYALTMTALAGLASVVATTYATRRGVEVRLAARRAGGARGAVAAALLGLLAAGLARDVDPDPATVAGAVVGAAAVAGVAVVAARRAARRAGRHAPPDEDD